MGILRRAAKGSALTGAEYDAALDLLGGGNTPATVTIAVGIVTVAGAGPYRVETEGATAVDQLDRINGTLMNDLVILRLSNNARQVIVAHGAFIKLVTGESLVLNNIYSCLKLRSFGSDLLVEEDRCIHV